MAYTDYYPNRPLFAAPTLRKEFAEKLRTALLKLKPGSTRHIPENGQYAIKERMQSRHDEYQQGYVEYTGSAHFAARDLL